MLLLQRQPAILHVIVFVCIFVYINADLTSGNSDSPPARRFTDAIKHDMKRYKGMVNKINQKKNVPTSSYKRQAMEEPVTTDPQYEDDPPIGERAAPLKSIVDGSVRLPMYAAAEYGMGQYLVELEVGQPAKKLKMVVDTGSTLTWVKCPKDPKIGPSPGQGFGSEPSKSYQIIGCDTNFCKEEFISLSSLEICPNPAAPCLYNYSYGFDEETYTYGTFGKDVITLQTTTGRSVPIENALVGCSETFNGRANVNAADGILGLGINAYSFSLHATNLFGGTFQYCLVDHLSPTNKSSYLVFGNQREKAPTYGFMRYTTLRTNIEFPYLFVNIKGISVGRKMLDIPPLVWFHENGGTIIDSGSPLSYWVGPAYRAIMDEIIPSIAKDHPKIPNYGGDGVGDFEYCFNTTTHPLENPNKLPRLQIHFADGARFKPHVKSYIIDDSPGVKCIGFLEVIGGVNVIGNILQQNYLWEFDLHNGMLGFSPSTCS